MLIYSSKRATNNYAESKPGGDEKKKKIPERSLKMSNIQKSRSLIKNKNSIHPRE